MAEINNLVQKAFKAAERGNTHTARKNLVKALRLDPNNDSVHNALGLLYLDTADYAKASQHFSRAVSLAPDNVFAINNYGVALSLSGDFETAITQLRRACTLAPENPAMAFDLANSLVRASKYEEASSICAALIGKNIDQFMVELTYGQAQRLLGQHDNAIVHLQAAQMINPAHPDVMDELARTYMVSGRAGKALEVIDRALALHPRSAKMHQLKSQILRLLGQFERATASAQTAVVEAPDNHDVKLTFAVCLLTQGHFTEGWKYYDARWQTFPSGKIYPIGKKVWRGEKLLGRSLLVRSEQGVGDEILFSTCLNKLAETTRGETVAVECDRRMYQLFSRTYPSFTFLPRPAPEKNEPRTHGYDVEIGFGSLPSLFYQDIGAILEDTPLPILVDPKNTEIWADKFAELGPGLKIGVAWRGGVTPIAQRGRSFSLMELMPILKTHGCHFINLQYGDVAEEITAINSHAGVDLHHYPDVDPMKDMDSQAAQISALDLIIQTSNTSAHLAGAMGGHVWVLQAASPYWPWFLDRNDMPWYSNVSQFRMSLDEDRSATIKHVAEMLEKYIQSHIDGTND